VAERSTPSIFCSAILPPPTISTFLPSSLRKTGYNDILSPPPMRHSPRRRIACDFGHLAACKERAQMRIVVTRKELTQVLAGVAREQVHTQQAFDGVGHFRRRAAVSDRTSETRVFAYDAAQTEVVGILHGAINLFSGEHTLIN
jgi:hypothetical protein